MTHDDVADYRACAELVLTGTTYLLRQFPAMDPERLDAGGFGDVGALMGSLLGCLGSVADMLRMVAADEGGGDAPTEDDAQSVEQAAAELRDGCERYCGAYDALRDAAEFVAGRKVSDCAGKPAEMLDAADALEAASDAVCSSCAEIGHGLADSLPGCVPAALCDDVRAGAEELADSLSDASRDSGRGRLAAMRDVIGHAQEQAA